MTAAPINLTPPETGVRDRPVVSSRPINPPFHSSYGPARPVPSTDVSRYPILVALRPPEPDDDSLIFPNSNGQMFSDMAFAALLRRSGHKGITAHGFRSSFRDWAADETDHAREVIEEALAHLVGDATERAYRRGDALGKRRALMDDWGAYVCAPPSTKATS